MADITGEEGQTLEVDYSVDNTGDSEDTQDIVLLQDGTQVDTDTSITLAPSDAAYTGTLSWPTTSGDAGTYTVEVTSEDDTDSIQVEVVEPAAISTTDYWPTDAASGTTVTNATSSRDMTTDAAWVTGAGVNGAHLDYDGSTSSSVVDSAFSASSFTMVGWFNADETGGTDALKTINSATDGSGMNFIWDDNGQGGYSIYCNGATTTDGSPSHITLGDDGMFTPGTGTWVCVAATADFNNSELTMYAAAANASSLSQIDSSTEYANDERLGSIEEIHVAGDGGGFDGGADAIAYGVDQVLSQSELDSFFQDTKEAY